MIEKKSYLSIARILCAFSVVVIHTNTCFREFNVEHCWPFANVIDSGLGFAVPIFIMISGATLLDYRDRYSTKEYFIRRIKKVLIPFLFWSVLAMFYIKATNRAGIFFVYLFFLQLFLVYVSIPIFSLVKKENREKVYIVLSVLLFFLNIIFPQLNNYLFFMLIGYLIAKGSFSFKKRVVIYVLAILGELIHICGTYLFSVQAGEIVQSFRGYTNLPCCLSAIGLFLFIKQIGQNISGEKITKFLDQLSGYTFAVYLIHLYIIQIMIEPIFGNTHSILYKIGTPFITFAICVVIAEGIRKIPVLKKCLP